MRREIAVVIGVFVAFILIGILAEAAELLDVTPEDFNNGTYSNLVYNGTGVVLSGANLSGTFTSRVFDAGSDARWDNISLTGNSNYKINLVAVDVASDVWNSADFGYNWTKLNDDYNGADGNGADSITNNNSGSLFVLNNQDVWVSDDSGNFWTKINDDFNGVSSNVGLFITDDNLNNLYVVDSSESIWKSIDSGANFASVNSSFNSGGQNAFGMTKNNMGALFIVDGQSKVWSSINSGVSWTKINEDYNSGALNGANGMVSNNSGVLFIADGQDIWQSVDSGVSWAKINDDFNGADTGSVIAMHIDADDYIYIAEGSEDIYLSTDSGNSFNLLALNINGGTGNVKGLSSVTLSSNLTFQYRNCSVVDCSDGVYAPIKGGSFSEINLVGRYFQYRILLSRESILLNPLLNGVALDYTLLNIAPSLNIIEPSEGQTYGYNTGIKLNYSVSDTNLDSCWYNLDSGENITLVGCANSVFNASNGGHILSLYTNDSSGSLTGREVNFSVSVGAPSISLLSPVNVYLNSGEVTFRYIPADWDLESCELWGNFAGIFELNQTDTSPSSDSENTFSLTLGDGAYLWNVQCSDSSGNRAFNGNKTFYVDTIAPSVSITEPTGIETNLTGIGLNYSIMDTSPISCRYNVSFLASGVSVIGNTEITNCLNATFDLDTESNYVIYLSVNDSAGNIKTTNTTFSIDLDSSSVDSENSETNNGGSTGSGSGGGFFLNTSSEVSNRELRIDLTAEDVTTKRGSSGILSLEAVNRESFFLNKCRLVIFGNFSGGFSSEQSEGLSAGEKFTYFISWTISEDFSFGKSVLEGAIKCEEGEKKFNLDVETIKGDFEAQFLKGERIGGYYEATFRFRELLGREQRVEFNYTLIDSDGLVAVKGIESISASSNSEEEYIFRIGLPKDAFGEFSLKWNFIGSEDIVGGSQNLFIPSGRGVSGFTVAFTNGGKLSISLIIVFIILLIALVRFLYTHKSFFNERRAREGIKVRHGKYISVK